LPPPAPTDPSPPSLHDALPISLTVSEQRRLAVARALATEPRLLLMDEVMAGLNPSEVRETVEVVLAIRDRGIACLIVEHVLEGIDRKSTRLNSSHVAISYAVFC